MQDIKIGNTFIGDGRSCYIIGEIGINHNGDVNQAKKLIDVAKVAGCNAVKFQKRTIEVVYAVDELAALRENPFGATNGDLKRGLEFGEKEYREIDIYCKNAGVDWFASCWDEAAVDFINQFDSVPCYKIASASLTDDALLRHTRIVAQNRPILLSTGMSTVDQIDHAVEVLGRDNLVLIHTVSTYPAKIEELNLKTITTLREHYNLPVGYSGHETGLATTLATISMGACIVERHITLDRAMWGSDQAASLEPVGLTRLVRDIRAIEIAMGDGIKRLFDREIPVMKKLRRK